METLPRHTTNEPIWKQLSKNPNNRLFTAGILAIIGIIFFAIISLPPTPHLIFDGQKTQVEIPPKKEYSIPNTGELTVSAWIRPATIRFSHTEGSGYIHWLGKGEYNRYEWTFRIYSDPNSENRHNRISFYVYNPQGGLGEGSYFQDPITPGEWIHVVGIVDQKSVHIYKNGQRRFTRKYVPQITPAATESPIRIGTRDGESYFEGSIKDVMIYSRALNDSEVEQLYKSPDNPPPDGVVGNWKLNDGHGNIARDSTHNSNNGNILNAQWKEK